MLVVARLLDGPGRFGDISDSVPGISTNVLSARLRQLEVDGLLTSTPYSTRPLRLRYELTDDGRQLADALALLASWGAARSGDPAPRIHQRCGTELEVRPWCPSCAEVVDGPDDDLVHL